MVLTQPLPRVDRMLQDNARVAISRPATDKIVIVAIDDKTLDAIGRFPWRRSLHAEVVRRISAQAPRCIGLDVLMADPDPDHPGDDAVLADAMLDSGCVVLPMALQSRGLQAQQELLPVPALAGAAAAIGHAHVSLDEDGIARSVYRREGFPGRPLAAFRRRTAGGRRSQGRTRARRPPYPMRRWPRAVRGPTHGAATTTSSSCSPEMASRTGRSRTSTCFAMQCRPTCFGTAWC